MLVERYRRDYDGEFVILKTQYRDGKKTQEREWIANPIANQHISGRAACIGSSVDHNRFDYTRLQRHRGGLRASKRLQTYACGDVWQQMRLNFYMTSDQARLAEISDTDYGDDTVCYSNPRGVLAFPGQYFLCPFSPPLPDLAMIVYLACFDGHAEVYLLGYTQDTPGDIGVWQKSITDIMLVYNKTDFYVVCQPTVVPESWRSISNCHNLTYRDFVSQCDV